MKKKKNGFTLFELLVTISIIAVLTAVAVVSFGGMTKKARDSRRMADLEKIRVALESLKQIGSTYPVTSDFSSSLIGSSLLPQIPKDPKTGVIYSYSGTNYTYQIGTSMEDLGSTNCNGSDCGCVGCNYKVVNP